MSTDVRKKILLISPMLHQGGFERICVRTARLLAPFYDVTIAIFDNADIAYDIDGLSVVNLNLPARKTVFGKAQNLLLRVRALRQLKKRLHIDLSYSFGQTANLANCHARASDRIICSLRSFQDFDSPGIIRTFCQKADLVACCSRAIEEKIRTEYGCDRTATIYNPVETPDDALHKPLDPVDPAMQEVLPAFLTGHAPLLVSMGREDEVKGFWHLLKAFAFYKTELSPEQAAGEGKTPGLLIIGDGKFTPYKQLAADLRISEDVCFTGALRNPFPLLQKGSVYVLTSIMEGFPNALVEAMSLGLPCIAADCPTGPKEILAPAASEDPSGILIPPLSAAVDLQADSLPDEDIALAKQIDALLRDPVLISTLSARAKNRAGDFSDQAYVETCREVFDAVLS